ncbi:MAG: hypothetical protein DRQ47_07230 [Gammaproteobacteria bacterium]|nr:MAG: hypothetical protein DRQ47_07230 [Gammaproteobacteria bacterium]
MSKLQKLIVCGVGGQGVTYTVRLLMRAAVIGGISVNTDEIHGLSQRGGVVNAGITFGEAGHGYVDEGEADYLIGLEKLEAQRCIRFLNPDSRVVIDNTKLTPFTVNSGASEYPDTEQFIQRLKENIAELIFIKDSPDINRKLRSYYVLGVASTLENFPIKAQFILQAIEEIARKKSLQESIDAFNLGIESWG